MYDELPNIDTLRTKQIFITYYDPLPCDVKDICKQMEKMFVNEIIIIMTKHYSLNMAIVLKVMLFVERQAKYTQSL